MPYIREIFPMKRRDFVGGLAAGSLIGQKRMVRWIVVLAVLALKSPFILLQGVFGWVTRIGHGGGDAIHSSVAATGSPKEAIGHEWQRNDVPRTSSQVTGTWTATLKWGLLALVIGVLVGAITGLISGLSSLR